MADNYPYYEEVTFLGFRICWHCNQQLPIDILKEQFLYTPNPHKAKIGDTFSFYIDIIEDANCDASWNTSLQHHYDHQTQRLYLSYLDGAIVVEINYHDKKVSARIMERALAYRAALSNWILTIPLSELLKTYNFYLMHAACLVKNGKGILFAGRSGAGKTTLSIGLLTMGWQLVSDDEIFLEFTPHLMAHGGPERAKVSWPTWRRFSYYLGEKNRYNGKHIVTLNDYFKGQVLEHHPISAVCFVQQSERITVSKILAMEAYRRLLSVAFLTSEPELTRRNNDFLYRLSQVIPAYNLSVNLDYSALDNLIIQSIIL